MSRRTKAIVALGLVASALLYVVPAQLRPENFPTDDAYFYLQVARNLAEGHGSTFNQITPTNGYHPLWMLVCTGIFALFPFDPISILHIVMGVQQLVFFGLVFLFYRLCKQLALSYWYVALPFLAVGFLATSMYGVEAFVNGLTVIVCLQCLVVAVRSDRQHDWILLGLACGFCVLARLDNVFLVASITLFATSARTGTSRRPIVGRLVRLLGTLGLIVGPYLVWNILEFGHLMPISGAIKSDFPNMSLHFGTLGTIGAVSILGGVGALGWSLLPRVATSTRRVLWTLATGVLLHAVYVLLFVEDNVLTWYWVPGILLVALLVCLVAGALVENGTPRGMAVLVTALLIVAGSLRAWVDWYDPDARGLVPLHLDRVAKTKWQNDIGFWLRDRLPPGTRVFCQQWPGAIAYFSGLPCLPQDGLMNDYEYNDALAVLGIHAYLRAHEISYLLAPDPPQVLGQAWRWEPAPQDENGWHMEVATPLGRRKAGTLLLRPEDLLNRLQDEIPNPSLPPYALWKLDLY